MMNVFHAAFFKLELGSIQELNSINIKEALVQNFEDWKTGYDQIDDVCVIGWRAF